MRCRSRHPDAVRLGWGIAADDSARTIADKLGGSPSTISREIARNGGRAEYRALDADAAAYVRARRPKASILCARPILQEITTKPHEQWSPQQISVWLRRENSSDPSRWVTHETIYRCLYIPSRKVFDSTIFHELRTDRPICQPRVKKRSHGCGRIRNMVSIDRRPAGRTIVASPGIWKATWYSERAVMPFFSRPLNGSSTAFLSRFRSALILQQGFHDHLTVVVDVPDHLARDHAVPGGEAAPPGVWR